MVNFGESLLEGQEALWRKHYIDYEHLKQELDRLVAIQAASDPSHAAVPDGRVKSSDDFAKELDAQIEKVVLFYLGRQGEIAFLMARLVEQGQVDGLASSCQELGEELVKLLTFLEVNLTALRKILKKHDKMIDTDRLTGHFLSTRGDQAESQLHMLSHVRGVNAITASLRGCFATAREASRRGQQGAAMKELSRSLFYKRFADLAPDLQETEPVLAKISEASERVAFASGQLSDAAFLAAQLEPGMNVTLEQQPHMEREPAICTYLNHLSTFMYMMNYYIILPSSAQYAMELGMPASFSGIIVGCAPLAVQISAFAYSGWTNYSFRWPLLWCSCLVLLGNVLYVLALPLRAPSLVLLGRIVTGLGAPRGVNRRYIADTVPPLERTAVSATFISAGSLGTAAGPGVAAVLNAVLGQMDFRLRLFGGLLQLRINTSTAPGCLMIALWAVFICIFILFFREPACRRKLSEAAAAAKPQGAKQPLLSEEEDGEGEKGVCSTLCRDRAMQLCLIVYFVLKLVQEGVITSTPLLTGYWLGWGGEATGCFVALLGLLVLPLNHVMSYMSRSTSDRRLMCVLQVALSLGILVILVHGSGNLTSGFHFVVGATVIFVAASMLEGVTMSLLSKVTPPSLAKGLCNSGLLSTEAGTIGRTCGSLLITAVGSHVSTADLAFTMLVPELFICIFVFWLMRRRYPVLY
eukprot:TRINITY_DN53083_c0_g1_i1.p1 TRINITY_DN53083_c0_g1~~TRINITY_DN53083_c0_g1_i1.p1  ORF type:complete len:695 (+),score=118.30 TRINITY_DN53083_c0_g1_i1:76-2160(+)